MFQLIIVVLAIALTAAIAVASIRYLPWWTRVADQVETSTRTAVVRLDQAYDVATRAANGVPPLVRGTPDGGYDTIFIKPILRLAPPTPANTSWIYGQHPVDASPYSGLNYFCLSTPAAGGDEALWRGVTRARGMFSDEQFFINSTCGQISNVAMPTTFPVPLSLTFWVTYVPGIDK